MSLGERRHWNMLLGGYCAIDQGQERIVWVTPQIAKFAHAAPRIMSSSCIRKNLCVRGGSLLDLTSDNSCFLGALLCRMQVQENQNFVFNGSEAP